ncbi:TPA: hypothetical protein DIC40_05495 [Patescibacteria group bacterium]|nr:hypothetical protein [Candidatus Gracilibacteria bacterium]
MEENKNTLTLKQIVLEGFNEISQTINKLIETQKRSFADLQKYIYQNSSLFGTVTPIKEEEVEIICKELSNTLTGQEVKICNNNKIDIDIFRKNKVITMTIIHTNFLLNKIDVSDEEAKKLLDEYLKDPDILSQMTYSKITKLEFVSFLQKTIAGFISFIPKDD